MSTFCCGNRHIGAGFGLEKDGARLQRDNRMENAMRDIDAYRLTASLQHDATVNGIFGLKNDNSQSPTDDKQCLILVGIEMAMRGDIRSGFDGDQQTVGGIGIARMKVAILAQARGLLGFGSQTGEQSPVNQRCHE